MKIKIKKRRLFITILIIFIALFIRTGFKKIPHVALIGYRLSNDNTKISIDVTMSMPIGVTRSIKEKTNENSKYIDFYSAFGFINGSLGAKTTFEIELEPSLEKIYFYTIDNEYRLVLQKNTETQKWELAA